MVLKPMAISNSNARRPYAQFVGWLSLKAVYPPPIAREDGRRGPSLSRFYSITSSAVASGPELRSRTFTSKPRSLSLAWVLPTQLDAAGTPASCH